ncbi:MAG: hypothetical protein ACOC7U_07780 [Spirochaetota bacterium]
MNLKKIIFTVLGCMVIFSFLWSCAGPKKAVVEEPVKEKKVEKEKEIAKAEAEEAEFKPIEWTTAVKDAEVEMEGEPVQITEEFKDYYITIKKLENKNIEVYLEKKGGVKKLLLSATSSLKPDDKGRIAFHVTSLNEENLTPVFDVLGLQVLDEDELRENYYLFGSFEKSGVSVLEAYDFNSSVTMKFTRK